MQLFTGSFIAILLLFNMHEVKRYQDQKPLLSFGVVADVQYADIDPVGNRYYRSSRERLSEAYKSFNDDSVSFVVNLGDLIDKDFRSYKAVTGIIDSSGLKTYHVTGNHDYSVESRLKKKLPVLYPGKGYFSFYSGNYKFIFLNGNEISTYSSNNKSELKRSAAYLETIKENGGKNAMDWNGGIGSRQLGWLKGQLDDAVSENNQVFLFCHFPVFPENVHNLLNYEEVLNLLVNYKNIISWFSGHNHAGNYGSFNKIHFVTFRGMVDTPSTNSYAIVDVYTNKLWIRGFGREQNQILPY